MKKENKFEDRHEARELAVETLYALDFNDQITSYPDLTNLPGKNDDEMKELPEDVLFYARYLISGVLSHLTEIDEIISKYSINRPLDKINYVDRNILRMSVFALLYEKDLHPSIVINEAVKLSQEMSTDVTYKFINGMLDNISKKEINR